MNLVFTLVVGALAGWLAGKLLRGEGFGLVGNMVLGILGAVVAGPILSALGWGAGETGMTLLRATFGAVVLLAVVRLIKKA